MVRTPRRGHCKPPLPSGLIGPRGEFDAKYPKAVAKLDKDWDTLTTFYDVGYDAAEGGVLLLPGDEDREMNQALPTGCRLSNDSLDDLAGVEPGAYSFGRLPPLGCSS